MVIKNKTGCYRCGGGLFKDDGLVKCMSCGAEHKTNQEIARYYNQNKEVILMDIKEIGPVATRKKWGIPDSTFRGLTIKWGVFVPAKRKVKREPAKDKDPAGKPETEIIKFVLPALPVWNDNWPPEIQKQWLEIWLWLAVNKTKLPEATGFKDGRG